MPYEKTIETIRALLAKAESTEFPAEADSFRGKARSMMARFGITEDMLNPLPQQWVWTQPNVGFYTTTTTTGVNASAFIPYVVTFTTRFA